MKTSNAPLRALTAMLLLPALCAGCALKSTGSTNVPIPTLQEMPALPPALAMPPPHDSFSETARKRIQTWQQLLTGSETR